MENVNLKRKVTLKRKGDTPDQAPEGKKPNKFIWLAILGVVIIGGIFGLKQLNQSNDTTGGVEEVIVSEDDNGTTATPENEVVSKGEEVNITSTDNGSSEQSDVSTATESVPNSTSSVENNVTSNPKSKEDSKVTKEAATNDKSKSKGNPIQSGTVSVQGSLEEKVKQVIRGDFGIGKSRKKALGADYASIQAKVNEWYSNKGK